MKRKIELIFTLLFCLIGVSAMAQEQKGLGEKSEFAHIIFVAICLMMV